MLNLIKTDLKVNLRTIHLIFWPLVFPLALGTLFYLGFGEMEEADFETIPVAVVEDGTAEENEAFLSYLDAMEKVEDSQVGSPLLVTDQMTEKEATEALENREVEGIFFVSATPTLTVGGVGLPESILQSMLEGYIGGKYVMEEIVESHPEGIQAAMVQMGEYENQVQQVSLGGKTTNSNTSFFYALIAMACLYGCFIGFGAAITLQANLTPLGARRCVASTQKMKLILSEMLVAFGLHFINVVILLMYLKYVLQLQFDGSMGWMLLISSVGGMIGVSMGIFIGSVGKWGEGVKIGILLGISMVCSFLAGLMSSGTKNTVEKICPILNRINPAALISDAFYCINVYDDPVRLYRNLITLLVMCVMLLAASFFMVRRERYDSI